MRIEKIATLVSSGTAALLVSIKLVVGLLSGSVALLASAIDSLLDLVVSLFNYFTLHQSERKPDETFNFGRGKMEAIAAVVEGTIICVSALYILYSAVDKFVNPRPIEYMEIAIIVMLVSIVLTAALVVFLNRVAKSSNNLVIKADALHYKTDLYTNAAVLLSLAIIYFSGFEIVDAILGVMIAIYMIYAASPILKEGIMMLLDVALEKSEIDKIKTLLSMQNDINGWHYLRTRRAGSDIFISVHIVFDETILLLDAHHISDRIERDIQRLFASQNVLTIIHLDPHDDSSPEHAH